ncbi:MAG: hypothetical protein ACEY3K_09395 [Wolbachia sp.]
MILEKLKNITKELDKSIESKSIIKLPIPGNLVNDIRESLELINKHPDQEKNITEELINIYKKLIGAGFIVQHECWDSFKHSLANNKRLSDKYDVVVAYENLSIIAEALKLLNSVNRNEEELNQITSLQKKMKEALEKMQQQQSAVKQEELEKKAKEEFGKYIKNSTIDAVSIAKRTDQNFLYATIKLKDDNKNTDIRVSEFLNSDFCKKNNIAGFFISSGNQQESISGYIQEGVRCYYLGTTVQHGIKFNWYVDGKECSITLGANSDGSIRIISDRPTDADLEKNKDVKIKVGNAYLSLVDAVKTCRQQEDPSSTVKQASANEHCRPLARTAA